MPHMSVPHILLVFLLVVVVVPVQSTEIGTNRTQSIFLDCAKFNAKEAQDVCAILNDQLTQIAEFAQRYDTKLSEDTGNNITSELIDLGERITNLALHPLLAFTAEQLQRLPIVNRRPPPTGVFYKTQACGVTKSRAVIGTTEQMMLDVLADCQDLSYRVSIGNNNGKGLLAYIYPGLTGNFPYNKNTSPQSLPQLDDLLLDEWKLRGKLEYLLMQPDTTDSSLKAVRMEIHSLHVARNFLMQSKKIASLLADSSSSRSVNNYFPSAVGKLFDLTENQRLERLAIAYPQLLQAIMSGSTWQH